MFPTWSRKRTDALCWPGFSNKHLKPPRGLISREGGSAMKRLPAVVALSTIVSLCGGGGGPAPGAPPSKASTPPPSPSQILTISGNWQFNSASAGSAKVPISFAGTISQSGSTVSGVTCRRFQLLRSGGRHDRDGTVTGSGSLTSMAIDGQVGEAVDRNHPRTKPWPLSLRISAYTDRRKPRSNRRPV